MKTIERSHLNFLMFGFVIVVALVNIPAGRIFRTRDQDIPSPKESTTQPEPSRKTHISSPTDEWDGRFLKNDPAPRTIFIPEANARTNGSLNVTIHAKELIDFVVEPGWNLTYQPHTYSLMLVVNDGFGFQHPTLYARKKQDPGWQPTRTTFRFFLNYYTGDPMSFGVTFQKAVDPKAAQ